MTTMRAWSFLIAGVAAIAVGTGTAATIEHARAKTARTLALAITLASTCTTDFGTTTGPEGQSVSVAILTCPRPAAQSASKAPL